MTDPRSTSNRQPPGHDVEGWHCWTGPSGTRYANPGDKPNVSGIISPYSDAATAPLAVRTWLLPCTCCNAAPAEVERYRAYGLARCQSCFQGCPITEQCGSVSDRSR